MPSEKIRETSLRNILETYFPEINIPGINSWEELPLLGIKKLKEISETIVKKHPELTNLEERINNLKEDEWQLLSELVTGSMERKNPITLLETTSYLFEKIRLRERMEKIHKLLFLSKKEGLPILPISPKFREKDYLEYFRAEVVVYLPGIFKEEQLSTREEKWALAFLNEPKAEEDDTISFSFEFNVLNSSDWEEDTDPISIHSEINSPFIFSIKDFYILYSLQNSNYDEHKEWMKLWFANLELDEETLQEYRDAFNYLKIAGERKKNSME